MKTRFSHFLAIDWSGAQGQYHKGIALALASADGAAPSLLTRAQGWSRDAVLALLRDDLPPDTLVGLDLGISLPFADCGAYFPGWDKSPADARSLWALVNSLCSADPHLSVSSLVDHPALSRYFRRHGGREGDLFAPAGQSGGQGRFRITELAQQAMGCRPYSNFNLVGAAQVGKSSLTGMRLLHRLFGCVPVWPIDPLPDAGPVIVEIYTTIAAMAGMRKAGSSKIRDYSSLASALAALGSPPVTGSGPIDDHSSDALISAAWLRANAERHDLWHPPRLNRTIAQTEGWTFGAV